MLSCIISIFSQSFTQLLSGCYSFEPNNQKVKDSYLFKLTILANFRKDFLFWNIIEYKIQPYLNSRHITNNKNITDYDFLVIHKMRPIFIKLFTFLC